MMRYGARVAAIVEKAEHTIGAWFLALERLLRLRKVQAHHISVLGL